MNIINEQNKHQVQNKSYTCIHSPSNTPPKPSSRADVVKSGTAQPQHILLFMF